MEFTKLKSTFTVNFYIETLEKFGEWVDSVMLMDKVWRPWACFGISVKEPETWVKNHRKKSEDF